MGWISSRAPNESFLTETNNWVARCTSPPTFSVIFATDTFIRALKAAGVWDLMGEIMPFYANGTGAAYEGLKGVVTHATVNVVNPTAWRFTPYLGVQGDGVTSYLDLGKAPVDFGMTQSSQFLGLFITSTFVSATELDSGSFAAGSVQISIRGSGGTHAAAWAGTSSQVLNFGNGNPAGLVALSRQSAAGGIVGKDRNTVAFVNSTSGIPLPDGNFVVGRGGTSGNTYSANQIALAMYGKGLSQTQYYAVYDAVVDLFQTLGQWNYILSLFDDGGGGNGTNYFTYHAIDNLQPPRDVAWVITPPPNNTLVSDTWTRYPISIASCRIQSLVSNGTLTSTWTQTVGGRRTRVWFYLWANRFRGGPGGKPNDTMGVTIWNYPTPNTTLLTGTAINTVRGVYCRPEYSSYESAIGATIAQAMYMLGYQFRNDPNYLLTLRSGAKINAGWGDMIDYWANEHFLAHGTRIFDLTPWNTAWAANQSDPIFSTDDGTQNMGDIMHVAYAADRTPTPIPNTNPVQYKYRANDIFTQNAFSGANFKVCTDKILLPAGNMINVNAATGTPLNYEAVSLDYEVDDNRTAAQAMSFFSSLAKVCRNKGFVLELGWFAVNSGSAAQSGITATNPVDITNIAGMGWVEIYAKASSTYAGSNLQAQLDAQVARLTDPATGTVPWSKIALHIGVGKGAQAMTYADAHTCRNFLLAHPQIPIVLFTPNYATPGGDASTLFNQIIQIVLNPSSP